MWAQLMKEVHTRRVLAPPLKLPSSAAPTRPRNKDKSLASGISSVDFRVPLAVPSPVNASWLETLLAHLGFNYIGWHFF